jgi:hypothetical protein
MEGVMAITIGQTEALPESYPASGLSPEPAYAHAIWQRIESYVAHRWTPRAALFVVDGPGEWTPRLAPFFVDTTEVWSGFDEWAPVELSASPLGGFWLPASGPYQFVGVVGDEDADVPAAVLLAFQRLAEYLDAARPRPGIRSVTAGSVSVNYRDETAIAEALQRSGAADLLRPYRRAA